ncbi:MAG: hypothetical protein IKV46_05635, partial [Bacteroidales bacterium]|nr:hypothetical protein [Bacteroidales bacterium]
YICLPKPDIDYTKNIAVYTTMVNYRIEIGMAFFTFLDMGYTVLVIKIKVYEKIFFFYVLLKYFYAL